MKFINLLFNLFIIIIFCVITINLEARTYIVTTASDSANASLTLRRAIELADSTTGIDTIKFNILPAGVHCIKLCSLLPKITHPVFIDGTSEPGYSGTPLIEIDGSALGKSAGNGLLLECGSSIIKGLVIYGFHCNGIGAGIEILSSHNEILGCYIGTNASGTVCNLGNDRGIDIGGSGQYNLIGGCNPGDRNVIVGNLQAGIVVNGPPNNFIKGNYIGVEPDGTTAMGNGSLAGVWITSNSKNTQVGGLKSGEGNIISGNAIGIFIDYACNNSLINNFIGTNASGTAPVPNGVGIAISKSSGNTIGSKSLGNVISGNKKEGILINSGSSANVVISNLIGISNTGTTAVPNGLGININQSSFANLIGQPGAGNTICRNGTGIMISGSAHSNNIIGNYIGTDSQGDSLLGNINAGIEIGDTSSKSDSNNIGGLFGSDTESTGNVIAYNGSDGIVVVSGTENKISRNSIYKNGGLGIALGSGIVQNDAGDKDTGPNNLQNYPVISLASADLQAVQGTLNSQPNTQYTLEFFGNYSPDPSGYGEGRIYLGTSTVTTDANGNADFTVSLAVSPGETITATATDPLGNTSEFSQDKSTEVLTKNFGNHFVVNTTVSGIPLHWPNGQSTYKISSSVANANSQFPAAIRKGYATWNNLPQINYTDGGNTTSNQWGGNPDGINNNVWITSNWEQITGTDSNTIGVTRVRYNTLNGDITDADIAYNAQDFKWSTDSLTNTMDVQNVATHEIGHYGGLGDLYNPSNVPYYLPGMGSNNQDETMYGLIRENETKKRTLDSGDVAGIRFIYNNIKSSRLDIMLVFDGSTSFTGITNAFTQAKNSALELVSNLRYGDRVGIVELPNTVILPLTSIDNETVRSNVDAAINGMTTAGSNNLGSGIQAAQNQLQINGEPTHLPVMILYSTGQESGSPTAESLLPSISSFGTEIFTIGYEGTNVAYQNNLNVISDSTKGTYSLASGATDIGNIIDTYFRNLTGIQLTYFATGSSGDLNGVPQPGLRWQGAVVDTGTTQIQPGLRWQGSDFGLSLEDPDGKLITQDSALTNPNIQFFSGPNYKYYKIKNPKPGSWSLYVYGIVFPPTPEPYSVYVVATTDVTMDVTFNNTRFNVGDTVTVQAELDNGGGPQSDVHIVSGTPITDATVTADVTLPDGTHQKINLTHIVNGLYKAQFTNTSSAGNYIFNINASKANTFSRDYSQTVYFVNNPTPTATSATNIQSTSFSANWNAVPGATGYKIDVATDINFNSILSNYNDLDVGNVTTLTVTNLSFNTPYYYRIRSYNSAGTSDNSNIIEVSIPLPVELSSFAAQVVANTINLRWRTATEINNYGFNVQRMDSVKNSEWQSIGFIKGNGTSNSTKQYSFIDHSNLTPGSYYYRLQQIDNDGSYRYSNSIKVNLDLPVKYELFQNYPNPFNPTTTISYSLPFNSEVKLILYNILGQEVIKLVDQVQNAGYYNIELKANNLSSGIYIYVLSAKATDLKQSYYQIKKMVLMK